MKKPTATVHALTRNVALLENSSLGSKIIDPIMSYKGPAEYERQDECRFRLGEWDDDPQILIIYCIPCTREASICLVVEVLKVRCRARGIQTMGCPIYRSTLSLTGPLVETFHRLIRAPVGERFSSWCRPSPTPLSWSSFCLCFQNGR